jgi:phosphoglucosamine mutase
VTDRGKHPSGPAPFFHAYDVRARFPQEISPDEAVRLGQAVGEVTRGPVLIGRDPRKESRIFAAHIRQGLERAGRPVTDLGIVPTPLVAFWARRCECVGLVSTPSHNALGYVGLKGFTSQGRIFGSAWSRIRQRYFRIRPGSSRLPRASGAFRKGGPRVLWHDYVREIVGTRQVSGTVVLDPRGGATARLAPEVFRSLGARVIEVHRGYSPTFFGVSPEPRVSELQDLGAIVRRHRALFGATWDGDGDRVLLVDSQGTPIEPEVVALLLYGDRGASGNPLVASLDTSYKLERWVRVIRCRVGTRYVSEAMRRHRASVGVEASSHIYLDYHVESSDGIRVAAEVACRLTADPRALEGQRARLGGIHRQALTLEQDDFPQARRVYRDLRRNAPATLRRSLEGFQIRVPAGRILVRLSNTQPAVRLALEGETRQDLGELRELVERWVRSVVPGRSGLPRPATRGRQARAHSGYKADPSRSKPGPEESSS